MLIMNTPHDIECVSLCFILLHVDRLDLIFHLMSYPKKKIPWYQYMALKKLYLIM